MKRQIRSVVGTNPNPNDKPKHNPNHNANISLNVQNKSLELLIEYAKLFDGIQEDWNTAIYFALKKGTKPYHCRPFP